MRSEMNFLLSLTFVVVLVVDCVDEAVLVGVEGFEGAEEGAVLGLPPYPPLVGRPDKTRSALAVRKLQVLI